MRESLAVDASETLRRESKQELRDTRLAQQDTHHQGTTHERPLHSVPQAPNRITHKR